MVTQTGTEARVSPRKVAVASFIGTAIEFFDFGIYSIAAALVFNELFFPDLSPLIGTLAAFATFGVAFVIRPVGAAIFGHFGDRIGRKRMLAVTLILMGVSTTMVGLLPTYAQIGMWAPILLVLSRMLQGIAVSGEWSGAVLMAMEHAPADERAYYASSPQRGVPLGWLLSTGSFALVAVLPADAMMSWGWRVPFLASGVLVIVGLYIRLQLPESPVFKEIKEQQGLERYPSIEVFRRAKKRVLIAVFATSVSSVCFYMAVVFALNYTVEQAGVSRTTVLWAVAFSLGLLIFTIPVFARLADRRGRRPVILTGAILMALYAFPFFWLLNTGNTVAITVAMVLAISIIYAMTGAPMAIFLPELFETRMRFSGSAIGYHVGAMINAGPVPFVAAALFAWTGGSWVLSLYLILAAALTFAAVSAAKETYQDNIEEIGRQL
ncbi:MFS transporter [Mycolicibacterium goodii]|uniref:Putative proline/betaine transporter n=1 Tax=Mycolicibacterium goodii TaxID=134601 RepID=A0A0K0XA49_MYCGD|nr:MFS transporter [Mycolicibacterium goodii]